MTGGEQLARRIVLIALVPVVWLPIHAGLAGAVAARATSASLQPLVREPYLQKVSAAEATVVWASVEPGPAEVRYRIDGAPDFDIAPAVTTLFPASLTGMNTEYYQHVATLTGLSPATTYSYDVFVGGIDATAVTDQLTTAPSLGVGTVRFIVFGDSGSGTAAQQRLAELIAADSRADRWDFALHVGDVAYPKSSYQFLHERFFAFYQEWLRRRPIFLAIGNHEDYAANGKPYLDLFVLP
jgi:phosphodiesterase/alkaline phosphatase D-like protein